MTLRNVSEAKAELSALIESVLSGDDVIIARAGKPVVRLIPYSGPARARKPGAMRGRIRIAPGFDTLPADIAEAFGASPAKAAGA
jgi:prevent-host-death family protein